MALSYAFGGNTGQSYEELQRRRLFAEAMMQRGASSQPKTAIEGINAAASSIMGALLQRKIGAQDAKNREAYNSQFGSLLGGQSQGAPYAASPATPSAFETPNPGGLPQSTIAAVDRVSPNIPHDFSKIEQTYGLPSGYLSQVAQIESRGNPNAQNPNSSAGGMFQFIDSTAKQYGLTDKTDPYASADAAARLAADNKAILTKALGREPTAGELYLAHQQGGGGAAALLSNPNAPAASIVGNAAINLNGGNSNMTAGDFANQWTSKIDPRMVEAMGNPYATDAQRSALGALLEQQLAANDPMKRLQLQKAQVPEMVTQRLMLAKQAGLQPGTPEYSTYMATGELPGTGRSDTPAAFASLDLQAQAAGFKPGTPEYQEFMRNGGGSGAPAAFVALDLQAKAAGFQPGTPAYQEFMATRGAGLIAEAKLKGADVALLDSQSSKMAGLETVVSELNQLADKATYTGAGRAYDSVKAQLGMEPREAAVARAEYIAKVDNQVLPMLRDTFGAAFTVKEGESLRATLGDPNKTPAEKKAVLSAFIEQKKRDIAALQTRTGKTSEAPAAPADDAEYLKSLGLE